MTDSTPVAATPPKTRRGRRILSGVALVLACLGIVLSTVAVWTHQVALKTDRFTPLVGSVVTDPAVTDPVSARISAQVVDALGVGTRLEARLPDALKPLAGTLAVAVQNAIDDRLKIALQDPRLQTALVNALSFTHEHVVRLLRDQSEVIAVVDGYVTLDVFPVVGTALAQLQTMGLIPADVVLPDLSDPEAPDVLAQRLESVLNVDLPPTFGTIQLMPADRLVAAQSVIRIFDLVVILLIALTALFVAGALWFARDRRRMLMYLGLGTIIAFLLARTVIRSAAGAIVGGIADPGVAGAAQAIVDAVLEDLRGLTVIVVIVTVILTIVAYLWGRPKWATTTATAVGDRAGRAGSAASTAAASYSLSDVTAKAPDRTSIGAMFRENRSTVERIGLGAIVFVVIWIALGLEIALLGAALVVGFEILVHALAKSPDAEDSAPTAEAPPIATT